MNKKLKFQGLRVCGLLTDLLQFKFYSYDPSTKTFCFDENLLVELRRTKSLSDMVDGLYIFHDNVSELIYLPSVADKIFSIILTAYVDGLSAIIKISTRQSTGQWERALLFANRCVQKFESHAASLEEDVEEREMRHWSSRLTGNYHCNCCVLVQLVLILMHPLPVFVLFLYLR